MCMCCMCCFSATACAACCAGDVSTNTHVTAQTSPIPPPPPIPPKSPPQTQVTIVGKSEIYNRENLVGPFLVHKLFFAPPPPPAPLKRHPGSWGVGDTGCPCHTGLCCKCHPYIPCNTFPSIRCSLLGFRQSQPWMLVALICTLPATPPSPPRRRHNRLPLVNRAFIGTTPSPCTNNAHVQTM